jgi:uncharacterized protein YjiS (DUF1127 family)
MKQVFAWVVMGVLMQWAGPVQAKSAAKGSARSAETEQFLKDARRSVAESGDLTWAFQALHDLVVREGVRVPQDLGISDKDIMSLYGECAKYWWREVRKVRPSEELSVYMGRIDGCLRAAEIKRSDIGMTEEKVRELHFRAAVETWKGVHDQVMLGSLELYRGLQTVDDYLEQAGMKRLDIGIGPDELKAVHLQAAENWWNQLPAHLNEGGLDIEMFLKNADRHLKEAGRTRADIGMTESEIAKRFRESAKLWWNAARDKAVNEPYLLELYFGKFEQYRKAGKATLRDLGVSRKEWKQMQKKAVRTPKEPHGGLLKDGEMQTQVGSAEHSGGNPMTPDVSVFP